MGRERQFRALSSRQSIGSRPRKSAFRVNLPLATKRRDRRLLTTADIRRSEPTVRSQSEAVIGCVGLNGCKWPLPDGGQGPHRGCLFLKSLWSPRRPCLADRGGRDRIGPGSARRARRPPLAQQLITCALRQGSSLYGLPRCIEAPRRLNRVLRSAAP